MVRSQRVLVPAHANVYEAIVDKGQFEDWALEIHEWLGLVALRSPRVQQDDEIDSYLSRYSVPDHESAMPSDIISIQWSGFIPAPWIRDLLIALRCDFPKPFEPFSRILQCGSQVESLTNSGTYSGVCLLEVVDTRHERWLALSAYAFHTAVVDGQDGYTMLRLPDRHVHKVHVVATETRDEKPAEQAAKEFVLWEVANASTGYY